MTYSELVRNHNALKYYSWGPASFEGQLGNSSNTTSPALVSNSNATSIDYNYSQEGGGGNGKYANNIYDAFYTNFEQKTFTIEFWFSFNNSFNGSGYSSNLPLIGNDNKTWSYSNQYFNVSNSINGPWIGSLNDPDYGKNHLEIIKLFNYVSRSPISKIFYDYKTNTFRYRFYGSNNTYWDAYIPVRNINTHFYIVATYKNGNIKISVNGEDGTQAKMSDWSLWRLRQGSQDFFYSGYESSIQNSNISFLLSDIAFYDYELTKEHQRLKVVVANHMDKPVALAKELETSMFDFTENKNNVYSSLNIIGIDFSKHLYNNNAIIDPVYGLRHKSLNSFQISDYFPGTSSSVTASGLQFYTQYSGLQMNELGRYFNKEKFLTISSQIILTSSANSSYLFSLPGTVDNQNSLYVKVNSTGIAIASFPDIVVSGNGDAFTDSWYDSFAGGTGSTETIYASISASIGIGNPASVGICINRNTAYLFLNNGASSYYKNVTIPNFYFNRNCFLILGNAPANPLQNNIIYKNFGINNSHQTTFSGYDFSHSNFSGSINGQFVARFHPNTQYDISQISYWVRELSFVGIGAGIKSTKVTWDGMDNALVQISSDSYNWTTINKGSYIPGVNYGMANFNKLLRIVVPYEYSVEQENQSFNQINFSFYKNLSFLSDDSTFRFTASSESSLLPIGMVRRNKLPIQSRMNNIGINFPIDSTGSTNSYATIYPNSASLSASNQTIYALDFWIKINSGSGTIIDDGSGNKLTFDGTYIYPSGSVSLNGQTNASYPQILNYGQYYHIFYSPSATASSVYINGAPTTSHMNAQYGYVNIWPYSPSAMPGAYNRYKYFVGNNIQTVDQNNYNSIRWANSSLIGNNAYSNDPSRTGIFAYRIG